MKNGQIPQYNIFYVIKALNINYFYYLCNQNKKGKKNEAV